MGNQASVSSKTNRSIGMLFIDNTERSTERSTKRSTDDLNYLFPKEGNDHMFLTFNKTPRNFKCRGVVICDKNVGSVCCVETIPYSELVKHSDSTFTYHDQVVELRVTRVNFADIVTHHPTCTCVITLMDGMVVTAIVGVHN